MTVAPTADAAQPDAAAPDTALPDTFVADTLAADTLVADASEAGPDWPACETRPDGATATTLRDLWMANPPAPKSSWVSGVVITAISGGGCATDKACQIYVQEESAETTLTGVAHRAMKVFVSAKAAARFTGLAVGDKVDVAAHAWRYTVGGQNELLLQVNDLTRGCAKKTGTGAIAPVAATLADLGSADAYENQYGPVLVQLSGVSGNTDTALTMTFGMFPSTGGFDAGATSIVSLSPYCLPAGTFGAGMAPKTRYNFTTVTGVYGLFAPPATDAGPPPRYLQLYPRTMGDLAIK